MASVHFVEVPKGGPVGSSTGAAPPAPGTLSGSAAKDASCATGRPETGLAVTSSGVSALACRASATLVPPAGLLHPTAAVTQATARALLHPDLRCPANLP